MNLPNLLTFSRVPAILIVALLLDLEAVTGAATGALILFGAGAFTDWLDGWIARRQGIVTVFGKLMDALIDKIFTLGAFVALIVFGVLPGWAVYLVLVILTREFLVTGLRLVAVQQGVVLAAERLGKWKTASQMTSILVALTGAMLARDFGLAGEGPWVAASGQVALILLALATWLTLQSGVGYFWKYRRLFGESKASEA